MNDTMEFLLSRERGKKVYQYCDDIPADSGRVAQRGGGGGRETPRLNLLHSRFEHRATAASREERHSILSAECRAESARGLITRITGLVVGSRCRRVAWIGGERNRARWIFNVTNPRRRWQYSSFIRKSIYMIVVGRLNEKADAQWNTQLMLNAIKKIKQQLNGCDCFFIPRKSINERNLWIEKMGCTFIKISWTDCSSYNNLLYENLWVTGTMADKIGCIQSLQWYKRNIVGMEPRRGLSAV